MKKLLAMLLCAAMMLGGASALAEYEVQGNLMLMPNPWIDLTAEDLMERTGLGFTLPEGAQRAQYRLLTSMTVAECQFEWNGALYVARIKPVLEWEDISGVMYPEFDSVEACEVLWCAGEKRVKNEGGNAIYVCLWMDIVPGLMYSLTTRLPEAQEFDIVNAATVLFDPAQGDVDGDEYALDAEYAKEMMVHATWYVGQAGSSLPLVMGAHDLLKYCVCDIYASQADEGMLSYTLYQAYSAMDAEQRAEFDRNLAAVASVVEGAFSKDEAVTDLIAYHEGMLDAMLTLTEAENAREHWTAFYAQAIELEKLYVLRQIEAAQKILEGCTGYAGTAGSSLKNARAACDLLEYCINVRAAFADKAEFVNILKDAHAALDEERKEEFAWNIESISRLIDASMTDYDAQRPLFETAGISAKMEMQIEHDEAWMHWTAFYESLSEVLNPTEE